MSLKYQYFIPFSPNKIQFVVGFNLAWVNEICDIFMSSCITVIEMIEGQSRAHSVAQLNIQYAPREIGVSLKTNQLLMVSVTLSQILDNCSKLEVTKFPNCVFSMPSFTQARNSFRYKNTGCQSCYNISFGLGVSFLYTKGLPSFTMIGPQHSI